MDVNEKSLIADLLNDYRGSLTNSSNPLYASHADCTGFSQQLVDNVGPVNTYLTGPTLSITFLCLNWTMQRRF